MHLRSWCFNLEKTINTNIVKYLNERERERGGNMQTSSIERNKNAKHNKCQIGLKEQNDELNS